MLENKQSINQFLLKKHLLIFCIGFIFGISVCFFLEYSELQENANYLLKDAILSGFCGFIIGVIFNHSTTLLNKLLPWQKNSGNRLFTGVLIHFSLAFGVTVGLFFLYATIFLGIDAFTKTYNAILIKLGIVLFVLSLIFEIVYFVLYSFYTYSTLQIATVKQERRQIELQLSSLKSQLSPHFLFNSLNAISSLIYKDILKAEQFIRGLAKMYDFTLKSYHSKLITLQEEMNFVKSYLFLLETRFENKFTCSISINDNVLQTNIPPLTIQMLVENALKHNVLSNDNPLNISIHCEANTIVVENNITQIPKNVTSFNIGLKNINSRYLLLVNKPILVDRSSSFKVEIPIIS